MMDWIKGRLMERTTLDGASLVAVGLAVILLGPLAEYVAYAAIVYGGWTAWKSEKGE